MVLLIHYVATAGGVLRLHRLDRHRRLGLHRPRELRADLPGPAWRLGAVWNTLFLAFGFVILTNVFGLLLALALNRTLKTRYLLRALLFMPVVLSPLAVSYMWKFIFQFNGPLNGFLGCVGLEELQKTWLADPTLVDLGRPHRDGLAADRLRDGHLPGRARERAVEIEEAAALDGAGIWGRFRHVTVPAIRPSIAIATTLGSSRACGSSTRSWRSPAGGPAGATETLATQVYKQTFALGNLGSARRSRSCSP